MRRRLAAVLAVLGLLVAGGVPGSTAREVSGRTDAHAVTIGATTLTTGSLYAFGAVLGGKPIRWNPCTPIRWQFRTTGAPTGGFAVAQAAVARVAKATGTTWTFAGATTSTPTTAWLPRTSTGVRPVLIGWTDAAHSDLLRGKPTSVLGVTRNAWFGIVRPDGSEVAAYKAAVIALDRTDRLPLTGPVSWRAVLTHELSHAMGLDHAGSSRELMYPVLSRSFSDLQSGDLAGLAKVGRAAGCISF